MNHQDRQAITDKVANIMDQFNLEHGPTDTYTQRRIKKRNHYHDSKPNIYDRDRYLKRRANRLDGIVKRSSPSYCEICDKPEIPKNIIGLPRRLVYHYIQDHHGLWICINCLRIITNKQFTNWKYYKPYTDLCINIIDHNQRKIIAQILMLNYPRRNKYMPIQGEEEFQAMLALGKKYEQDVIQHLESLGHTIKDISMDTMPDGRYSPFDIIIDNQYIVDIKYQGFAYINERFWTTTRNIEHWNKYETDLIKAIIFTTKIYGHTTYRYITLSDLEEKCFNVGSTFSVHINYDDTIDVLDIDIYYIV